MRRTHPLVSLLSLLLVACSQVPPVPTTGAVDRIVVTPAGILLTDQGESAQLSAQALNADGDPVEATIAWEVVSGPITISDGLVTSTKDLGSAQLVAKVGAIRSAPVPVLIAEPIPGTVLISDDQVIADPVALEGIDTYGYGWTYRVTLSGLTQQPDVGDIVMAREARPISGRVTEVMVDGDTTEVTLALVPVKELFARLDYDEVIDLSDVVPELSDDIAGSYSIARNDDGGFDFTPDPDVEALRTQASPWADGCKIEPGPSGVSPPANLEIPSLPSFSFTPGLSATLQFDPTTLDFQRIEISGNTSIAFNADFAIKGTLQGKVTCDAILGIVPIPIPPPLMAIFFPHVGLGLGIEVSAKVTSRIEFELFTQSTVTTSVGIDCTAACTAIGPSVDATLDWTMKPTLPGITADSSGFEFEVGASGFASAKLIFGNPIFRFFRALQLEAVQIKAGLKNTLNLQPKDRQAAQSSYGSGLKMDLFFEIGAGDGIQRVLGLLQISIAPGILKTTITRNLMAFPNGTVDVTGPHGGSPPFIGVGDATDPGDLADFDVQLNSRDFSLFGTTVELVENVELFWWKQNTLEPGRPPCTTISSTSTSFTCSASFLQEHAGDNTFYAFVNPEIFGFSIPVPLEVNNDAKIEFFVDPAPEIAGDPSSVPTNLIADEETDVTFTLPFDDIGENIAKIHGTFEFQNNPNVFNLTWEHDEAFVTGFTDQASGSGTIEVAMIVYCSEKGTSNTVTVTWQLEDELGQLGAEKSTTMSVSFGDCSNLQSRGDRGGFDVRRVRP